MAHLCLVILFIRIENDFENHIAGWLSWRSWMGRNKCYNRIYIEGLGFRVYMGVI